MQYGAATTTVDIVTSGIAARVGQSASTGTTISFSTSGVARKVGLSLFAGSTIDIVTSATAVRSRTATATTTIALVTTGYALSAPQAFAKTTINPQTFASARKNGAPDVGTGPAWVVNLDSKEKASTRYSNYEFNSFFQIGVDTYGVTNDGVYLLDGDSDDGTAIDAGVALIRSDLGVGGAKHVPSVYVGAASDGELVLRVDADGVARRYRARTSSAVAAQHRVDIGKGVRGSYWALEVLNENGDDFILSDLTLLPVALGRRT